MSKKNETKRYIVTYATDEVVSQKEASEILGVNAKELADGVSLMATDLQDFDTSIMHFENVGASILNISDTDAEALKANKKILAVEEDFEVFTTQFLDDEYVNNYATENHEQLLDAYAKAYTKGYMEGAQNNLQMAQGPFPPFPPFPQPPFPQPPFPQPPFPFPPFQPPFGGLPIRPFPIPFLQPKPWGVTLVKADRAWARGINGSGIKVAVIDTGSGAHTDLSILGGASFVPGIVSFNDDNGHGTHVAGTIAARNNSLGVVGVAHRASLYSVKVLAASGSGSFSWILAGMEWAFQNRMDVVNMSLGSKSAPSVAYATAIRKLQDANCVVVCAAGNSFGSTFPFVGAPANSVTQVSLPFPPISFPIPNASPIAVAAIDSACNIANFSSRGGASTPWNQVTVAAPGVAVNSTFLGNSYRSLNGTSMASPHVAGAVALIKQRFPGITVANVKAKLIATAQDLGAGGFDTTFGAGLINCDRATL